MSSLDMVLEPLQRRFGTQRMAYFFVLPNLLIFGIFILFPMLLNFYYAFTGGILFFRRIAPSSAHDNLQNLCSTARTSSTPIPATSIFFLACCSFSNTVGFVVFQVGGMIIFAMITALILNRRIKAAWIFPQHLFYPVLLSPVVVGLIWKWILQRDGVLNAIVVALGGDRVSHFC